MHICLVLNEESDLNWDGQPQSHFGMYLEAMQGVGVDMREIEKFMLSIR